MLNDQQLHPEMGALSLANEVGNSYMHNALPSAFDVVLPPGAKHFKSSSPFEFQPTEVCPVNFIIIDQSDKRNQIMFHPAVAHKLNPRCLDPHATCVPRTLASNNTVNEEIEMSSSMNEDWDDIDALLSFDEEEQDDDDDDDDNDDDGEDDEVSTARTHGDHGNKSPDSCSTACSGSRKISPTSSLKNSVGSDSSCKSKRKRLKMRRMVKALQGIVPGGSQMNSVAVIDEAVRYLKSLKVEVQKLGVGNMQYYD